MDVERIQKVNALALDLLRKGLAPDREAAVAQAEQVYRGQDGESYTQFQRQVQEVRSGTTLAAAPVKTTTALQPDLSPEKVKDILEQNTQFLVKKIKEFQEKVESLERELSTVKNQMLSRTVPRESSQVAADGRKEVPIISAFSGAVVPPSQSSGAAKAETPHPRSGSWKQEDVSIEKFFYMGRR